VSWSGVLAGTVAGLGAQLLLSLLGTAIGVATLGGDTVPRASTFLTAAGLWLGVSLAGSAFVGGLVASKSSRYLSESHGRLNGLVTGTLLSIMAFLFTMNTAASALRTTLGVTASTGSVVTDVIGGVAGGVQNTVRRVGGIQTTLMNLGLGTEFQAIVTNMNRDELMTLISERVPQLCEAQVVAATDIVLSEIRNAGMNIGPNVADLDDIAAIARHQADALQMSLNSPQFIARLRARDISESRAREVAMVVSQRVAQIRSMAQSRNQALMTQTDQLRREAAATTARASLVSLLVAGLMIGLGLWGGHIGSGVNEGEGILRLRRRRMSYTHTEKITLT
jgi:hypothetical protein